MRLVTGSRNGTNSIQALCHSRLIAGYGLPPFLLESLNRASASASANWRNDNKPGRRQADDKAGYLWLVLTDQ